MFKTFLGKFTLFFWLTVFIVNLPLYLFGNFYFKDILKSSEQEKIALMIDTLKPIIALNISFNQEEQLHQILNTILKHDNVKAVTLTFTDTHNKIFKSNHQNDLETLFIYNSNIKDPFNNFISAKISLVYSNKHLNSLYNSIFTTLFFIFLLTLIIFTLFFIYIRRDFNALKTISDSLLDYSRTKKIQKIVLKNKSKEIQTITNVANEMMSNIAKYVKRLKSFNSELKKQVKEKVKEQQEQEQLLIHQSRQAAMGEMLESIAHQWRQPLNIIGLATANLETLHAFGTMSDKDFQEKMEIVSLNINYMSNTIDDFRDFLNPDREKKTFNPQKSIQEVLKILHAQLKNNNIRYKISTNVNFEFFGVENEFKQVLFVIINNAKDAIKNYEKIHNVFDGTIMISLSKKENNGLVEIVDNGGGIKESIIGSIFDPYFTTKFSSKGTGIGLYIAKNIIQERMGGSLQAKNLGNNRTCFTITLPIAYIKRGVTR